MATSVYTDFITRYVPRILSDIDRDPNSPTYGSCDRDHWHYKIRDFDSAILQQSGLTLALLYLVPFQDNRFYQNENVKNWSEATVHYWVKIQLKDGAFNEYYPHEHGFPPTAFSLFSVCRTCMLLGIRDEPVVNAVRKTAAYLCKTIEKQALNQEMASIAGLYAAFQMIGEGWILDGCNYKLQMILAKQSDEGWFAEYGGADIGYLSVCFDMLCEYYRMSKDMKVIEPIHKVLTFLTYFAHPDGTIGGEYGSRNTTYFLPFGVEVATQLKVKGAYALKEHLYGDSSRPFYFMDGVDDRYLAHYVLHSFLRALQMETDAPNVVHDNEKLPFQRRETHYFDECGLLSYHGNQYSVYAALQKGGILKVFCGAQECFLDCGYRVNLGKKGIAATNWQDPSYQFSYDNDRRQAKIQGRMNRVKLAVATPILHMGLRVVSLLLGKKIISMLKRKIILVDKHTDIIFSRTIQLNEDHILLEDHFKSATPFALETASNMSLRHVASGKFFMTSDLLSRQEIITKESCEISVITRLDVADKHISRKVDAK